MAYEFTPYIRDLVLGKDIVNKRDGVGDTIGIAHKRTPLHVDYGIGPDFAPSRPAENIDDADEFNAVGSYTGVDKDHHLPVFDIDGGAIVQMVRKGSKAILSASYSREELEEKDAGRYGPKSLLRDVLGDYGIDLEVFQYPHLTHGWWDDRTSFKGNRVSSIVLRTDKPDIFAAFDSTNERHSHLYVNRVFEGEDHRTLISELGKAGIVGRDWQELAEKEGQGIVRTPWTVGEVQRKFS